MNAEERLVEAWAVLAAATRRPAAVRVEPTDVAAEHGPVLAGLDIHGGRHVLVPVPDPASVREDRRSAGVQIRAATLEEDGHQSYFLDVVCLVPRLNDLFATVAVEMLEGIEESPAEAPRVCRDVLERWRELLDRPDTRLLGPEQLGGLYGELTIVAELIRRQPASGLDAWTGPTRTEHDFVRGDKALEVKATTTREGRIVQIHGATQLDPPPGGILFFAFIRLDVGGEGQSVPALVDAILDAGADRRTLHELLARAGYDGADALEYDRPRFAVTERRLYAVDDGFPRIVPSSFPGGDLPAGVLRLRYDIDLTGEPPTPLSDNAVSELLDRLAQPG